MTCDHAIDWDPLNVEYDGDGLATAWQAGNCRLCHRRFCYSHDFGTGVREDITDETDEDPCTEDRIRT